MASPSHPMATDDDQGRTKDNHPIAGAKKTNQEPEGVLLLKSLGFVAGARSSKQQDAVNDTEQRLANESKPIEIADDGDEIEEIVMGKRKLTSSVWDDFKRVKIRSGEMKAQCNYCHKKLTGKSTHGTKHLHDHLKICVLRKIKLRGQDKTLAQTTLRFGRKYLLRATLLILKLLERACCHDFIA
ncbi:hypothetical protein U9M48_027106 [Paspalum notatum var. saurae]|uniref:BED-type domain-containing protein n=1 Tax=Paspalum notatum var. saurae TaxID=547442 RepID=A0AAQ3TU38_PASNO